MEFKNIKQRYAACAAGRTEPDDFVYLDAGTTTGYMMIILPRQLLAVRHYGASGFFLEHKNVLRSVAFVEHKGVLRNVAFIVGHKDVLRSVASVVLPGDSSEPTVVVSNMAAHRWRF